MLAVRYHYSLSRGTKTPSRQRQIPGDGEFKVSAYTHIRKKGRNGYEVKVKWERGKNGAEYEDSWISIKNIDEDSRNLMLGDAELLASAEMSKRLEKEGGYMEAAIESGRELLGIPTPAELYFSNSTKAYLLGYSNCRVKKNHISDSFLRCTQIT